MMHGMLSILSLLVENRPGVLFKVTHMFRSRNFNITSISVGETSDSNFSRMTITTNGNEKQVNQIAKQLDKMIDVIKVEKLDEHSTIYRELILFKIKISSSEDNRKINDLARAYNGTIHAVRKNSIIVEMTATPEQINAFENLVKPFGILQTARTGMAALLRGNDV
ncbi:MAG: acetolactate synthase small subunit [Cenarchaeum symbiont of Oopsacas minuta]|nr:acetolactate synthase small subunit [Cenarchaeum symbiont of Oopsacas minuta]